MRQCAPPRLAHSLHRTRLRPHSAIRIRTEHVSCELLAATHTHNTLHCTCTFLHSAHNKRVMIFLDTASTTHAPRASSRFSHALRASTALYCTRIRNRERKWLHLCSLLRWLPAVAADPPPPSPPSSSPPPSPSPPPPLPSPPTRHERLLNLCPGQLHADEGRGSPAWILRWRGSRSRQRGSSRQRRLVSPAWVLPQRDPVRAGVGGPC